ncbi:LacI family DNA-binding transcriptional regulator [Actinotalea sp.]|mgnify:CR=1 FL=1|uniref:LacI family DNA-binding transcriptional regulator n=1 Tax=Actinotalea sp. TaxID=1872145 RepID=UPI002C251A4A|nr:LacI family DNA-binding transcriptional regulator [Actinotalea sp.]HQY32783.1 LacI family DNA-binding transcriptional regulator [Actinotalea sp.]HRA50411.1 LacI family DNA-binding transcriptional regulator [Actinotalea sp.]
MAATMRDVARLAGVSIKTVSNVVNGYRHVTAATRARVLTAIDELGYQVNVSARNLRTGRTGVIALAVPELSVPYFAELADAVIAAAAVHGLTVLIELHGADRAREIEAVGGARRRTTDGLIFSPVALGAGDEALVETELPMVLLGERVFHDGVDHVTMQNVEAARAATEHLLDRGRRRIAAIGVHPGEEVGSAGLRLVGYRQALAAAGIPTDDALLGVADPWHRAAGARAMAALLDAGALPDAVFGFNDALALGAMHELQVRGLRVPQDVAVIGFDDIDEGVYANPSLSTVDPGREQIARTAVQLLVDQLDGTRRAARRVFADYRVVARGSTAPSTT